MSRTKDQWIKETGGFRLGETDDQFKARVAEITRLRRLIADGKANEIERYATRVVTEADGEFALATVGLLLRELSWAK